MKEYEIEPQPGLPEPLPKGEHILWQGAPSWRGLMSHAMPIRSLLVYFTILAAWRFFDDTASGVTVAEAGPHSVLILAVGALPIGLLALYSWVTAYTTLYTITDRRVVMRFGLALPVVVNVPFSKIASAALGAHADGTGDIPLTPIIGPSAGKQLGYLMIWPHARPWRVSHPEPMLRAIAEPERVARLLSDALAAASDQVPVALRTPAPISSAGFDPSLSGAVAT